MSSDNYPIIPVWLIDDAIETTELKGKCSQFSTRGNGQVRIYGIQDFGKGEWIVGSIKQSESSLVFVVRYWDFHGHDVSYGAPWTKELPSDLTWELSK